MQQQKQAESVAIVNSLIDETLGGN